MGASAVAASAADDALFGAPVGGAGLWQCFCHVHKGDGRPHAAGDIRLHPEPGGSPPLLLADVMRFGKKRAAFVEYYDCTAAGAGTDGLSAVFEKYRTLPDYTEKPAWYVGERMPCSLIKGGEDADDAALTAMLCESAGAYGRLCAQNPPDENAAANLRGLEAFVGRMVREGNPSGPTMRRVLGRRQAELFFTKAVMPARCQDRNF